MLFLTLPPFVNWYPNEIIDIHPFGVSDSQAWIYVRPAELIALPFLSLALRDPLEITIQYHFPASVAQRPVSGTLVMENYQLAQMKWPLEKASQNISPSHTLSASLFRTTSLSIWLTLFSSLSPSLLVGSTPLKLSTNSTSEIHNFAPPACSFVVGCLKVIRALECSTTLWAV